MKTAINLAAYRRFWILGAGHFGKLAVERIRRHIAGAEIVVIDEKGSNLDVDLQVSTDGVRWLSENLEPSAAVDMVIPAIPLHVAAEWLRSRLVPDRQLIGIEAQADWLAPLPNVIGGRTGQYYVSHADFICPDTCPEPESICTHTKKPRPVDLFRLLGSNTVIPIVIRSYQLLPGVGGLLPADLFRALAMVPTRTGQSFMVATACRCHGVVDFLQIG